MKRQQSKRRQPQPQLEQLCCGKVRYATREAALTALARIINLSDADKVPIRAYECHAGWWHLTSKTVDEHRDRIMTRRDTA